MQLILHASKPTKFSYYAKDLFFNPFLVIGCGNVCLAQDEPVILHPLNNSGSQTSSDAEEGKPVFPRSPIYIPSVYLSEYTLLFEECCIGCEIEIMENDEVVYSTIITDANGTVQLPEDLSGNFELHLYWGSFVFVGEIDLE